MFGKLFGNSGATVSTKNLVWMNQNARLKGVQSLLSDHPEAFVVAWFSHSVRKWNEQIGRKAVEVNQLRPGELEGKMVVVLEHYPLYSKENEILSLWKAKEIVICCSLDDALIAHFGGEQIKAMMEKMGMKEDELLDHSMITSAIQNAQKKLEKQVGSEMLAESAEDWFAKNAVSL